MRTMARAWASAPSWKQRYPNPNPNPNLNPNHDPDNRVRSMASSLKPRGLILTLTLTSSRLARSEDGACVTTTPTD